ncbi:MAG: LytS/YhcK type 5TM receptor domain-containing protein [Pseudomonadota bacterium]
MAYVDASVMLDFVSSLAVLGLLVVGFSALAPVLKTGKLAAVGLGMFFGLVVGLQMSMPLSPTQGVIIDMRHVPIVLAGAFLGWRGLVTCLALAIAIRTGIGGVGLSAGILGMLIAGAIGDLWSRIVRPMTVHDAGKLAVLGLGVNLHMLSAFVVPADITRWYFTEAAPTIFALNVLCVPAFGWMLMREQNLSAQKAHLSASAQVDPATRLLTTDALAQEVSHFNAADGDRQVGGFVAITLKNTSWLRKTWGDGAITQALGVLRLRITDICRDNRPLGIDAQRRVLVPVTAAEMRDLRPLRKTLRRLASDTPISLDGGVEVPLAVLVESFALRHPARPEETVKDIRNSAATRRTPDTPTAQRTAKQEPDLTLPEGVGSATFRRLFRETDVHMKRLSRQS